MNILNNGFSELRIEGLSFCYASGIPILHEIDLQVKRGERIVIVGPNGSGKSSLLRAISGNTPLLAGNIFLNSIDIQTMKSKNRAKILTLVPQAPKTDLAFEVREFVAMGRYPHLRFGCSEQESDWTVIEQALHWTGLEDMGERRLTSLSGGERQRAVLAQALAQETPVLMLDEPNTYLDLLHQLSLLDILLRLNKELEKTIILVLHDLNLALTFADRIVLLSKGKIAGDGLPGEVLNDEMILKVFGVRSTRINLPDGKSQFLFSETPK